MMSVEINSVDTHLDLERNECARQYFSRALSAALLLPVPQALSTSYVHTKRMHSSNVEQEHQDKC